MAGVQFKTCLIGFITFVLSIQVTAQSPMVTQKQLGMFLNSVTCVVIENEFNPYNVIIKDAVEKYWKVTAFEFIDLKEFENRRFDSKYSFLVQMKNVYDKDPGGVSYNFISLVLGGSVNDLTKMPELCNVPFQYADDNSLDYEYAMPVIVKFIQIHAKNLEKKSFIISIKGLRYYNSSGFKDKQLIMNKDKMAPDASSVEKINKVYPYYVKMLSSSQIKDEIVLNPNNALFHFHVGPNQNKGVGKCFEMIFDVNGNLYYYSYRKITNENVDGFNIRDFKRIN
jgi:hypothetical protein